MAALAAELQFSCCSAQLASISGRGSSGSDRHCSAGGFSHGLRSGRVEATCGVSLTARKWLPVTHTQGNFLDVVGVMGGERGFTAGRAGSTGRRSVAVQVAMGRLDAPKPTFVPLEGITGEAHFDQVLSEAQERNQPIVIDWLAAWCRKCIYLKPKLEKLAAEYHPDIKFYFIDVNTVPQALVKRAEVTKMPTIQLWKDGKRLAEVIGGHQVWLVLEEVREMINLKK